MKKAFTLIELVAILAIFGIMALLILPRIGDSIEDRKETQYNNLIESVKSAAKVYYANDPSTSLVSISTLISEKYLSSGMTNPITGNPIEGCVLIEQDTGGYNTYTYYSDCSSLHEYTLTNLITNGSFESGSSNWTLNTGVALSPIKVKFGSYSIRNYNAPALWSVANNSLTPSTAITSHKYYVGGWIYTVVKGTSGCYLDANLIYNGTDHWQSTIGGFQSNLNIWEKQGKIYTMPAGTSPAIGVAMVGNSETGVQDCYGDGAFVIDLTASFGAGNEPNEEWCDNNIDYFASTTTIWK